MNTAGLPPATSSSEFLNDLPPHLDVFQLGLAATIREYYDGGPATATPAISPSQRAFTEAVSAISGVMPILMHGSGDVVPDRVDPDTVQLLSELTVHYIANLVDAALDAQRLLAGGAATTPPPPRYPRSRNPPPPSVPHEARARRGDDEATDCGGRKKRPRRPDVDYWDEPLPEPKIVRRPRTMGAGTPSPASSRRPPAAEDEDPDESEPVHVDRWVGAVGVDFWEQSRSRAAYVRMPDAIGVQCFIFPICHDGYLYGKVMQVQASRRQFTPVLVDSVLLDLVRAEGALARKRAPRRKKADSEAKDSGDADVEEEPDQEEDDDLEDNGATWPGLEFLLPVHALTDS